MTDLQAKYEASYGLAYFCDKYKYLTRYDGDPLYVEILPKKIF